MIEITTDIKEYTDDTGEYTFKEYIISSSYPNSIVKIFIDDLQNQIFTDEDGVALISIMDTDEHSIEIMIETEHYTDEL